MKYTIDYEYTWEGTVEIEADSREEAEDLFYDAVGEGALEDEYCPKEFPAGGYKITKTTEKN